MKEGEWAVFYEKKMPPSLALLQQLRISMYNLNVEPRI